MGCARNHSRVAFGTQHERWHGPSRRSPGTSRRRTPGRYGCGDVDGANAAKDRVGCFSSREAFANAPEPEASSAHSASSSSSSPSSSSRSSSVCVGAANGWVVRVWWRVSRGVPREATEGNRATRVVSAPSPFRASLVRDEGEGERTSTLDPESGSSTPSLERAASARSSASSSGRSDESFSTESGDASRDARDSRDAGFGDRLLSTPPPREDPAAPEPSTIASRGVPRDAPPSPDALPPGTRSREWLRRSPQSPTRSTRARVIMCLVCF